MRRGTAVDQLEARADAGLDVVRVTAEDIEMLGLKVEHVVAKWPAWWLAVDPVHERRAIRRERNPVLVSSPIVLAHANIVGVLAADNPGVKAASPPRNVECAVWVTGNRLMPVAVGIPRWARWRWMAQWGRVTGRRPHVVMGVRFLRVGRRQNMRARWIHLSSRSA